MKNGMKIDEAGKKRGFRARLAIRYGNAANETGELVVLRGRRGVTVYGCRRILSYSPCEIKLALERAALVVTGSELYCSSFAAGTVTVEGRVTGVGYRDPADA